MGLSKWDKGQLKCLIDGFKGAIKDGDPHWRVEAQDLVRLVAMHEMLDNADHAMKSLAEKREQMRMLRDELALLQGELRSYKFMAECFAEAHGTTCSALRGHYMGETRASINRVVGADNE